LKVSEAGAGLASFLKLSLKAVENVLKGEAALSWLAHICARATNASKALLWHTRTTRTRGGLVRARCRKGVGAISIRGAGLEEGGQDRGRVFVLVLLGTGSSFGICLGKNTNGTGSDFVVDNCLVIFANNVDSELLKRELIRSYCC
jgi:hypothetical protein